MRPILPMNLVPVDCVPCSEAAPCVSLSQARVVGSEVVVLHVIACVHPLAPDNPYL